MKKLSVVIITHNEEGNIRDCMESVKWADEIVVLDSFSEDNTVSICREYTDKIFQSKFTDFSLQKNMVLDMASHEWVLSLDADERVSPQMKEKVLSIISSDGEEYSGYYFKRRNYFFGRWVRYCGLYPDYVLRLFRKSRGRFRDTMVHESVSLQGNAAYMDEYLQHYTFRSISDYVSRMEYYSTLSAAQMNKDKKKSRWYKLVVHPFANYMKMYYFKKGFLDGSRGLVVCFLYSWYTFMKYAKLWEMQRKDD